MSDRYARVSAVLTEQPWALLPGRLEALIAAVDRHEAGRQVTVLENLVEARMQGPTVQKSGAVAVLPLHGTIAQRMNMMTALCGGTSSELFGQAFDQALADPSVAAIVISIDSPGGQVAGTEELARKIFQARGSKPIVAVADSLAASAAYWIGAQADQFVASPSSQVGSIGIVTAHTDVSKAEEMQGQKTTVLAVPPAKAEAHPYGPLTEDAHAQAIGALQPFYDLFVKAVARGRGISAADVRDGYGQGRVLAALPAKDAGMVDRIETLSEVVARLSTPQGRRAALAARVGDSRSQEIDHGPGAADAATAQESAQLWARVKQAEFECLT